MLSVARVAKGNARVGRLFDCESCVAGLFFGEHESTFRGDLLVVAVGLAIRTKVFGVWASWENERSRLASCGSDASAQSIFKTVWRCAWLVAV